MMIESRQCLILSKSMEGIAEFVHRNHLLTIAGSILLPNRRDLPVARVRAIEDDLDVQVDPHLIPVLQIQLGPLYTGRSTIAASKYQMIFVAGNYRLGAFGWLSGDYMQKYGQPDAGLYDQALLFQWV